MKYNFKRGPAPTIDLSRRVQEIVVGDELVYDAPHTLCRGLRRKREPSGVMLAQLIH